MVKSYSQKLRVLYVMQVLLRYSDEEHPISQAEISERLNAYGIQADRKSIYDDIKVLNEFGLEIENRRAKPSGFYVAERSFELPELKLLVDAVQSSKFITAKKSNELIRKLEELASVHEAKTLQRQVFIGNRIKTMNESIYYNVDKIHQAISQNRLIRFHYYEWTPQKEMHLRRNGKAYEISPWGLTWDDENYYMVGYDGEAEMIKHFRVDKMLDIEITDQPRSGKERFEKFDLANYAKKVFGMFSGEEHTVKMLCENNLAGAMIDRFGRDVMMHPVDEEHFSVSTAVNVSPQFFGWLVALGKGVVIESPEDVREEFGGWMRAVMREYGNELNNQSFSFSKE